MSIYSENTTGTITPGHELLKHGVELVRRGDLDAAFSLFEDVKEWARKNQDQELWDRATCNQGALEAEHSPDSDKLAELRRILLRTSSSTNAFLAAYNVARAYEQRGELHRALFYARIARSRCERTDRRDWLGWSSNQMGNLLLADSRFDEASDEYVTALEACDPELSLTRAALEENLAYCRIVQKRYDEGFRLLLALLRKLNAHSLEREQTTTRLTLCYGYLEYGKLRAALRHGLRGLELASRFEMLNEIRNAHYLLGETYNQLGHRDLARFHFRHLQQRFYPATPHITDLLLAIDVRPLINLKA